MNLRFFVICYGDAHADMYERVAVRSLTTPLNRAAIPSDAVVSVYSDAATMERVSEASARLGTVERHEITLSENHYDTQNKAFIDEVGRCVKEDAALVIVQPDNFWGDGSLGNLLAIAGEQNVCVAVPHPRVDREEFLTDLESFGSGDFTDLPWISNSSLVTLAMRTLHRSWREADTSKPEANSFYTGIGIREISPGLHAVSHLQPTVFFARLNARDYGFFAEHPNARGLWDHAWPAILAQEGRQRTVASSDAVFIVELTDAETHSTDLRAVDPRKPDEFCRMAPHIDMNRNVVAVWRENTA